MCEDRRDYDIATLEVYRMMKQGAILDDNLAEMFKDEAWRRPRLVKVPQILQALALGAMQANSEEMLPHNLRGVVESVYEKIDRDLSDGQPVVRLSTLDLFKHYERWCEYNKTCRIWAKTMDLKASIYNAALRVEEETSWVIVSSDNGAQSDLYERWKNPRLVHVWLVPQALVMSIMKTCAKAGQVQKLPFGIDKVIEKVNKAISSQYTLMGDEEKVIETDLHDLMGNISQYLYSNNQFRQWLSSIDPDEMLLGATRWLHDELNRLEDAREEGWKEEA